MEDGSLVRSVSRELINIYATARWFYPSGCIVIKAI
nr:MAG TPA: hypothetical protein [Caudoviricetes sp.]